MPPITMGELLTTITHTNSRAGSRTPIVETLCYLVYRVMLLRNGEHYDANGRPRTSRLDGHRHHGDAFNNLVTKRLLPYAVFESIQSIEQDFLDLVVS